MTPDELRSLADEATPGGDWNAVYETADGRRMTRQEPPIARTNGQARLINLAPDLARLCAEQHEMLRLIATGERPADSPTWHSGKSWRIELARSALAKLSELNNGAEEPPALERT